MDEQSFRDIEWLKTHPLTPKTALDYFSKSQFYDPTCCNQVLRMQGVLDEAEIEDRIVNMLGIRYKVVDLPSTDLILIEKLSLTTENAIVRLDVYYILMETIFMAPRMHKLLTNRINTSLFHLHKLLGGISFEKTENVESNPPEYVQKLINDQP